MKMAGLEVEYQKLVQMAAQDGFEGAQIWMDRCAEAVRLLQACFGKPEGYDELVWASAVEELLLEQWAKDILSSASEGTWQAPGATISVNAGP